ncbi:hypothetical protein PanWU01x14_313870 [Parasponia andersonii]|uniref:Uncharacterized protein n=1 Tax=Parasponia andersonii TaxID=3476 RepID=A0A2P5AP06_PARAD|nr:hypothetical protein PanWU01x14_313870 [Parasponia andersonii]
MRNNAHTIKRRASPRGVLPADDTIPFLLTVNSHLTTEIRGHEIHANRTIFCCSFAVRRRTATLLACLDASQCRHSSPTNLDR